MNERPELEASAGGQRSARQQHRSPFTGQNYQLDRFSSSSAINSGRERRDLQSCCPERPAQAQQLPDGSKSSQANNVSPTSAWTGTVPLVATIPFWRKAIRFLNKAAHRKATLPD